MAHQPTPGRMTPLRWLQQRDPGFVALRRAGRTAVVMPAMLALSTEVIGNITVATFASFGSFALLLFVEFGGPMRDRLRAELALALAGAALVCLGTLASSSAWTAAVAMTLVGFGILFAGVVSSVLASATTSLVLAFSLPVSLNAPVSAIPDRLAGWGLASAAALLAVRFLWPVPARDPIRDAATDACRAVAERLRAEMGSTRSEAAYRAAVERADVALGSLNALFFATPYRPTGLSSAARAVVRLVDELRWLGGEVVPNRPTGTPVDQAVAAVTTAAATVLERSADLLRTPAGSAADLRAAVADLRERLAELQRGATRPQPVAASGEAVLEPAAGEPMSSLHDGFRAQELSFVVSQIARNVDFAAAADRRSWLAQLLGRQPEGLPGALSAAQERASAHTARSSVWLRNSVRGAAGLGLAVLVARVTDVENAFWVVLGTLAVLRSNAFSTGQDVLRALTGTVGGLVLGTLLVTAIGTDRTLLWVVLPPAILVAGLAPAAFSLTAAQAGFTVTLLILFNILAPTGWEVGLVRIEDVAIGCAVALLVGLLFWPRGAASALGIALADAYRDSATYLARAVRFGIGRCDAQTSIPSPADEALRAAAASRRLDDAFRTYLAERGPKRIPLSDVTALLTGVVGLRLAGDAVLDLWHHAGGAEGERAEAREELLASAESLTAWYDSFAAALTRRGPVPDPLVPEESADARLVAALSADLHGPATAAAVRLIWTGDHLDAARGLQQSLVVPARSAVGDAG